MIDWQPIETAHGDKTEPYPHADRCTCNSQPFGHRKKAMDGARIAGSRAFYRHHSSHYLFCDQMEQAWRQGYSRANKESQA